MVAYQSFGFSTADVLLMLRRYPRSMAVSEEKLSVNMGFLMELVGLGHTDIVMYPQVVHASLENLVSRCAVLSLLMREGKVKESLRVPYALFMSKKRFQEMFLSKHAGDVPDVVRAFNGEIAFRGFQRSKKEA